MVAKAGTAGMLRVRFKASQRDLALTQLRDLKEVQLEAQSMYRRQDEQEEPVIRRTAEKLAAIERALDQAEGSEPGRPFELVAPTWLLVLQVDGCAVLAIERAGDAVDALRTGETVTGEPAPDARGTLRRQAKVARIWMKTLLAVHDFVAESQDPGAE